MLYKHMLQYYELTREQRRWMFSEFKTCTICNGKSKSKRLVVDHCHKSGVVRGILCERCNSWLGVTEGCRSQDFKNRHLEKIKRRYGIDPNKFKSYLNKTKFLKNSKHYSLETANEPADDFKVAISVSLEN